jgi:hypothetical protein
MEVKSEIEAPSRRRFAASMELASGRPCRAMDAARVRIGIFAAFERGAYCHARRDA